MFIIMCLVLQLSYALSSTYLLDFLPPFEAEALELALFGGLLPGEFDLLVKLSSLVFINAPSSSSNAYSCTCCASLNREIHSLSFLSSSRTGDIKFYVKEGRCQMLVWWLYAML